MRSWSQWRAALGWVGATLAVVPPLGAAEAYKLAAGPHAVAEVRGLLLPDTARNKELSFTVRYPREVAGPLPVVLFSHGLGGNEGAFPELSHHWASYGYAVIHPTHADPRPPGRGERPRGPRVVREGSRPLAGNAQALDRRSDIGLFLDSFAEIERLVPGLRLDRERIAMAGHSAGAFTTQLVAGVRVRPPETTELQSYGDPRVKVAILISGQGVDGALLTEASWAELALPMLVITGSEDRIPISRETPETRQHPFRYAKPGGKYLLFLTGATHSSYQGPSGEAARRVARESPPANLERIAGATTMATLAFLDGHLRGDATARAYLAGDQLVTWGRGDVRLERK